MVSSFDWYIAGWHQYGGMADLVGVTLLILPSFTNYHYQHHTA